MQNLRPKNLLILWLMAVLMTALFALIEYAPYLTFYPKEQCELRSVTLSSVVSETSGRSSKNYSIFIDDEGNEYKLRKSVNDYEGRKTELLTHGKNNALREQFELTEMGAVPIFLGAYIVVMVIVTFSFCAERFKRRVSI